MEGSKFVLKLKHLLDFSKGDWINQINLLSAVSKSNKSTTTAKKKNNLQQKLSSQALIPIRKQIYNLNTGRDDFQSISKIKPYLPCKEALNTINKNFTVRNAHKFASILNYSCKALRSKHYNCTTYPLIEVYNRIPPKSANLYTKGICHSRSVNRTIERDVKPMKTSRTCLSNNYFMKTIDCRLDLKNVGCHKSIINNTINSYLTKYSSSCSNGTNNCRKKSHPNSESKNRKELPAAKKLPLSVRKLSQTPYNSKADVSHQKSQAPSVCLANKSTPKSSEFPLGSSNECTKTAVTCDHSKTDHVCKQLIKDSIKRRLECISKKDVCEKKRGNDKCTAYLCKELIIKNIQKHLDTQTIEPTCKIYMPQEGKSVTVAKIPEDERKKPEIVENMDKDLTSAKRREENVIQDKLNSTCKAHVSTHTPADKKLAKEVKGSPPEKKTKSESKPDSTFKVHVSTLTPKKKSKPSNLQFAEKVKSVVEDKILKIKLFLEIEDRLNKHQNKSSQQGHLFYIHALKNIPLNLMNRVLGGLDTKRDKKQLKPLSAQKQKCKTEEHATSVPKDQRVDSKHTQEYSHKKTEVIPPSSCLTTSKNTSKSEPWKEPLYSTTSGQPISHKKTEEVPTHKPSKQSERTMKTEPCKQPVTSKHIPEKSNLCTSTSFQPSSYKKTEVVSTSSNITKPENKTNEPCKEPIISKHVPEKSTSDQPSSHKKTEEIPTCGPSTQPERITKREPCKQPITCTHISEKSSRSTPCCKGAEKRSTTQDQSYPCNPNIEKPVISCSKRRRTSGSKPEEHDTTSKSFKSDAQTDSNMNTCAPSNKNASFPEPCKSSRSWPCKSSKKECSISALSKPESKNSSAPSSPCAPNSKQITDPKPCNTGMSSPCQPDKKKCSIISAQCKTHEESSSSSRCSESTKTSVCDKKQMKMEPPCSSASAQSKTHEASSSSSRCSESTKTSVCDKKQMKMEPPCSSASAQSKTHKESSSSSRCSESTKTSVCDKRQIKMEPPCSSKSASVAADGSTKAKAFICKRMSELVCEKSSTPEQSVLCDVEDAESSECTCDSDLEKSSLPNSIICESYNPYESISNNSVKAPSESKQTYRLRFKETLNKPAYQPSDKSEVCDSDDDISKDEETICDEIKAVQGNHQNLSSGLKRPGEEVEAHSKEKKRRIDSNQTDKESPCTMASDIEEEQEETGTKYGGIPSFIFQEKHSASEEISKKGIYKNPEYFSYHKTSFHDIIKLIENKFQPQPSSKKVPADSLSAKKNTSKRKGKGDKGSS